MKAKTPTYGAFIRGLLTYKLPLTLADFLFNILIFGHGTALSFFARQILNRLDAGSRGQALGEVAWYLAAISLSRFCAWGRSWAAQPWTAPGNIIIGTAPAWGFSAGSS
jgi:hypothetical protein